MITIMTMMIILKMFFFQSSFAFRCFQWASLSSPLPWFVFVIIVIVALPLLSSILPSLLSSPQGLRHHRHHRRRLSRVYHLPPKGSLHHHKHHYHIACHRINIMAMIICHDRLPFTMIVKICFP